ncbi:MAG: hypothetical protein ACPG19_01950 [Saprospiraceae bacterium]
MKLRIIIIGLMSVLALPFLAEAQNVNTEFGKNRVQYHGFEWWEYETRNFIVYWYQEGRNVGQSVVQMAELDHEEIRSLMEYRISDKIEILVYTDLTDLKQSNIGKNQVFSNSKGITNIVDNKMFVYFDGDHNHLREQIRQGISRIYLNYMMYGGNIQEIVQNAVLLNLPEWFTEGLVSYVGEEWNTELDNKLRDGILSGKYNSFQDLIEDDARLAGHSFWYFLSQNYGKATVSNLLYLTRINRSVENGFLYVLGTSFYRISGSWYNFYKQHYSEDANVGNALMATEGIPIKNKRNIPLSQVRLSPNGQQIAYSTNELGKIKVYIQDIDGKNRKLILKNSYKNVFQATDYNYPLLTWSKNGNQLAVFYEKRDKAKLLLHDLTGEKSETLLIPTTYERVLSADFIDNRQIAISAIQSGYSDIYLFDIRTRQSKAVTRDYHDDMDATFATINGRNGIIFASNRDDSTIVKGQNLDTLLPVKTFDLYFYDTEIKNNTDVVRLTNTPLANEKEPRMINDRHFSYLSNETGIYNRYIGYVDTIFAYKERVYILNNKKEIVLPTDSLLNLPAEEIDTMFVRDIYKPKGFSYATTNYSRNILEQHTAPKANKKATLLFYEGKYQVYIDEINTEKKEKPIITHFMRNKLGTVVADKTPKPKAEEPKVKEPLKPVTKVEEPKVEEPKSEEPDTGKIDIDNYFFQSEFEDNDAREDPPIKPSNAKVEVDKNTGIQVQEAKKEAKKLNKSPIEFRRSNIRPHRLQFKSEFLNVELDNSPLFDGLTPTVDNQPDNSFLPLGILGVLNINDLFEDYTLRVGMRIPITFDGAEYFAIFDDESKRLDKRFMLYRSQFSRTREVQLGNSVIPLDYNLISSLAEVQLRYPLDIYQSFRAIFTGRIDNTVYELVEPISLLTNNNSQERIGMKLEYVFDNTADIATNIKHGTRMKATAEVLNRFAIGVIDSTYFEPSLGLTGVLGVDVRHYQKLDKHSILAARFAAYSSFGSNKILYFLGGASNWPLFPSDNSFNRNIPIPSSDEFVYQGVATNLRGFKSNIRNGNSYALANLELRVPITKYITRRPINNNFVRNLQLVGFFDAGSAWEGLTPFREDNPLNTTVVQQQNGQVKVTVNYFRNPIVMGYGFGVRTMLLGYFVRLDYAWGVETGVIQEPRAYFSIGTDF